MNPYELAIQRTITERFIDADTTSIVLQRATRLPNGSGGFVKGPPMPLPKQEVKLSWSQDTGITRETEDGRDAAVSAVLIFMHDADVQRWDLFTLNGERYEVVFVKDLPYEVKAEVVRRG